MFESTDPFLLFDYFRVPYTIGRLAAPPGCGRLLWRDDDGADRSLVWTRAEARGRTARRYALGGATFFADVLHDDEASESLAAVGGTWTRALVVEDARGVAAASVWRNERGDVFLPFDPGEAIANYWSEGYQQVDASSLKASLKRAALWGYYRARPAIPRSGQVQIRRLLSRVQSRSSFPRWPIEPALHDLYERLLAMAATVSRQPLPSIAPWPNGFSWALVLTHDVETSIGYENLHLLRDTEAAGGYRSAWNFVPRRDYDVDDERVRELTRTGFEIGVHGLYHDGRDVAAATLSERLPAMRECAKRWNAIGFRSPATRRDWSIMPSLGFDYDSSYPDTDPFEPQAGGCCSWLPYFNGDLVELPITLPQDWTLFGVLRHGDETVWLQKAHYLRDRGGMALLITHPDYMLERSRLDAYDRFLGEFARDETVWRALPSQVSAWWRSRSLSRLELVGGAWRVEGPAAARARVQLIAPDAAPLVAAGSNGRV